MPTSNGGSVAEVDGGWRDLVWRQFGAAIDMLEGALLACPERVWADAGPPRFWYLVYHTLFWLDLYLSGAVGGFRPPPPYTLDELDPAGVLPERVYTKDELHRYLGHCRERCRTTMAAMTPERARARCRFGWGEVSFAELQLYNLRHVQHHAGQLNLILRQRIDATPGWVCRAANGVDE